MENLGPHERPSPSLRVLCSGAFTGLQGAKDRGRGGLRADVLTRDNDLSDGWYFAGPLVHRRLVSSIPGLCPLCPQHPFSRDDQKCLWTSPVSSGGAKPAPVEHHGLRGWVLWACHPCDTPPAATKPVVPLVCVLRAFGQGCPVSMLTHLL